jgi:hypothetical protein
MPETFAGTEKQHEIMNLVFAAADGGRDIEFHELKGLLSYGSDVTKQALQFSIRYLEQHGMVARKYGHRRKLFLAPTMLAYQVLRSNSGVAMDLDPVPPP